MVVFKTKVLYFKIENTPIKDADGKRKFKRMLRFLFVDKWKLFVMKLSFEKFKLVFFTAERLVLSQSRQRGFLRNLRYILYSMVKKCSFLKGNFHGRFPHFSTFWLRRERKTTKFARFEIDFMLHHAMCSADVTCVNGSTVQLVLRELLLRINSWVFENKFSRNHFKSSFKAPVGLIYFRPIWGGLNRDGGLI